MPIAASASLSDVHIEVAVCNYLGIQVGTLGSLCLSTLKQKCSQYYKYVGTALSKNSGKAPGLK